MLNIIDTIKLTDLPRLGDFAKWGEAIARTLGFKDREFLEAYYENIGKQDVEAVENTFVGEILLKLYDQLESQGRTIWVETIRALLNALNEIAERNGIDTKSKHWPKITTQLSRALNELRTSLLDGMNIEVTIEKLKTERRITDEIQKDVQGNKKVHIFKRDTTLVTIKRRVRKESESSIPTSPQSQEQIQTQNQFEVRDATLGGEARLSPKLITASQEKQTRSSTK